MVWLYVQSFYSIGNRCSLFLVWQLSFRTFSVKTEIQAKVQDTKTNIKKESFQAVSGNMDIAPFKLDTNELIADYDKENNTALADFKRVWKAKKFSYLYEGRPKTNSDFFMRPLFLHCIGHLTSPSSLH